MVYIYIVKLSEIYIIKLSAAIQNHLFPPSPPNHPTDNASRSYWKVPLRCHGVPPGCQRMGPWTIFWARNAAATGCTLPQTLGWCWLSAAKRRRTLSAPIGFTPLTARARSSLGPSCQRSSPPFTNSCKKYCCCLNISANPFSSWNHSSRKRWFDGNIAT